MESKKHVIEWCTIGVSFWTFSMTEERQRDTTENPAILVKV